MNIRPLDRSADRSGVIARRASVVALAAAVVIAPVFAAAPAFADASVVVDARFLETEVVIGGVAQGIFTGGAGDFFAPGFDACMFEYKDGTALASNATAPIATATAPYATGDKLVAAGFAVGDTYTVSYADPISTGGGPLLCVAPPLSTPGLVQASIDLAAAPPAAPEIAVSAAPLAIQQGVPFDVIVPITAATPFDFSNGGYVDAGPRSSAGYENGEPYPYKGITFEYSRTDPGVTPVLRIHGTPELAGISTVGFEIGDGTSVGFGELTINTANKAGILSPITMEAAIGAPVAGSTVTIIAAGLKEGAAWDVTVRSTPVVVGSGTIAFGGQLSQRVTIPAGLAAGSHSITVTSTRADGTPYSAVLYFTVSATGTLLSVSLTAPQLAATGTDLMVPSLVAGGLLIAGLGLAGVSVYRRRNSN